MITRNPKPAFLSALLVGLSLALTACGGDSTTEPETPEPEDGGTIVDPQTPTCKVTGKTNLATTACPTDDQLAELTLDNLLSDSVAFDSSKVFKVPSGAEIVLTTTSGDADLYLYSSEELTNDNLLCYAREPFGEDNCTADVGNGELYAEVYGREASSFTLSATTDCSVASVNEWVYRNMKDYYLYADQVPAVNPADYSSASDLVRELRNNTLDPYSGVRNAVQQEAFYEEGIAFGFGYNWDWDDNNNARVTYTLDNSPMGQANINRGDIINSVNGVAWNELDSDLYSEFVGTRDNPLDTNWAFTDGVSGESKVVTLKRAEYTTNTVLYYNAYTNSSYSGKIGYIVFNEFLRISETELDIAINWLIDQEVTELVLDLRYNPGGFTSIARKLASQIGGPTLVGETLVRYQHNSKYSDENYERQFETKTPTLDLSRVVVLTTNETASSSELVINSLRPYMEVITLGDTTRGKAFISSSRQFCGQALNAMKARGVNNSGVSVEGGLAADCYARDDVTRDFGKRSGEIEGMLLSSLDYFVAGTCNAAPFAKAASLTTKGIQVDESPFSGTVTDTGPAQ